MLETGNGTVTPVVSNLRIDPALVDDPSPTSFLPSSSRMLYLLDSSVKYIYMPFYPCALVYQDWAAIENPFKAKLARQHDIPKSTLTDRINGRKATAARNQHFQRLDPEEEAATRDWILRFSKLFTSKISSTSRKRAVTA